MSGENIELAFSKLSLILLKKIQNGTPSNLTHYPKGQIDKEDLKPRLLNSANKYSNSTKLTKESKEELKEE
jgi:hypothetical protein